MDIFKIKGLLGPDTCEEMDAMDADELKATVVQASQAMQEVKEELEANEKYQQAKQACSDLSAGKKEVDKRQKGKIQYALSRLTELGSLGATELADFSNRRNAYKARQSAKTAEPK